MRNFQLDGKPAYDEADACLEHMLSDAERQRAKDDCFVRSLLHFFRPGTILEIGAGVGQMSLLLKANGRDVIASDVQPWMVEHMRSRGLKADVVDATDILGSIGEQFDNVFAQGPSPLVTNNLDLVGRTYRAIYAALNPLGRFVFVFPDNKDATKYSRLKDHWPLIHDAGFRKVAAFRHQVLPSRAYIYMNPLLHGLVEGFVGRWFGMRCVAILERP